MHHLRLTVVHRINFKFACYLVSNSSYAACHWFLFFFSFYGGRKIVLSELDPFIRRTFVARNWVSLCEVSEPPPAALIREFYSNLSIYSEVTGGHYLTTWIRSQEFTISKQVVFEALGVPLVRKPIYPYTKFPVVYDMMSLFCGRPVSWGSEPRINSCEFTELNSLYLQVTCYNIYPISHVHTVPIRCCAFLYALIIDGSMCFPFMFIQTFVDVYRSKSKGPKLFFPLFIFRILRFLELSEFPSLELVHVMSPIGTTYLRQRQEHMKSVEPSTGMSKKPRGDASTTSSAMLVAEETFVDLAGHVEDVDPSIAPSLSLKAMM